MKFNRIIILTIILSLLSPKISWCLEKEEVLIDAISIVGAKMEVFDLADWSIINRVFMDFETMEKQRDDILDIFDAKKQNFTVTKEFDDMYRILITEGMLDSDIFLQITFQSVLLPGEYEKEPQTYLVISVNSGKPEKMGVLLSKIREAITSCGGKSKITSCVTGTFNGKLDRVCKSQIIGKITEYFKIDIIRQVEDEYIYSLVGESPLFDQGVEILDKHYNLNIAMRYNSEDDITYIWIGTPIISIDY